MGQAKQRGTYEQRLAAAQERNAMAKAARDQAQAERDKALKAWAQEQRRQLAEAEEKRRQEYIAAGIDPDAMPKPTRQDRVVLTGRSMGSRMRIGSLLAAAGIVMSIGHIDRSQGKP